MTHPTDDELVLHYYGEGDDLVASKAHLGTCAECRARFGSLEQAMTAMAALPVPDRDESYGSQVWLRLQPRLEHERPGARTWLAGWFAWPRLAYAGGLAVIVVAAFVAGRFWPQPPRPATTATAVQTPAVVQQRILLVAVGDHLDRTRMVLAEISNLPGEHAVDISAEQDWARDLVASNRLYRQAATRDGKAGVVSVLEELERVLLDIANSPSTVSAGELQQIRQRIESEGLLFKVKVLGSQVRQRASDLRVPAKS